MGFKCYSNFSENDFQTPGHIVKYMISLIPPGVRIVLEPTPGEGNIVNVLDGKYEVTYPEDFFLLEKKRYDCIIMNPPFSSKYANTENAPKEIKGMKIGYYILYQCMEISDIIIALMPWFTISDSDRRLQHIMEFGLKSLTALPRNTFKYSRIQTVVMELVKGFSQVTRFHFLKEKNHLLL
ncbi:MAG: hypothetical protein JXI43_10825 [Tissierellales bacterium]|nr:hypothetical protein [Tissierellales bacterium]